MADAEKTKTDDAAPATGGVMDKVNEFLDRPVMNGVEINRPARDGPASRRKSLLITRHAITPSRHRADAPTSQIPRAGRDDRRRHRKNNAHGRARGRRQGRAGRAGERLAEGG